MSWYRPAVLRSLELRNFRTFQHFSMEGLGNINLCVGTNNCGKTSVLEAVSMLASRGRPESLWSALSHRGEYWFEESQRGPSRPEADICHLFHGHGLDAGSSFSISATCENRVETLLASIVEKEPDADPGEAQDRISSRQTSMFDPADAATSLSAGSVLRLQWSGHSSISQDLRISRRGGLRLDMLDRMPRNREGDDAPSVRFVTTEALSRDEIVTLFDDIVLTEEEIKVVEALRTIEPSIERIAPLGSDRRRYSSGERGGVVVKLTDSNQRIPIGSMGDGIWRLLGIALSLVKAQGGILLVDEIDTGLHHAVMDNMWRLVRDTAVRLNVQVFATTHSRDCWESLASISRPNAASDTLVSIQRIERGKPKAVAFSESEIVVAVEDGIEIR
jgi:hypothetical protein